MPHTLHTQPPYTNTLNCSIVATLLRLHWTSLNPHKHTHILVESFLDSSYSKLRLTHSPAYPPLHLHSHLKSCCYITLTLAKPFLDFSNILKSQTYSLTCIHSEQDCLLTHGFCPTRRELARSSLKTKIVLIDNGEKKKSQVKPT